MTAFHELGEVFFENISLFDTAITTGLLNDLQPVATGVLTLFILWRVGELMLGAGNKTAQDTLMEMMVWSIIWTFVFQSTYLNSITSGMNEVYSWAGGGIGFFDNLDSWWEKLFKIADNLYSKDHSMVFPGRGVFALGIVSLAAVIVVGVPFIIIIMSSLVMQILIMLTPFMILTLLFPAMKKTFFNWVELFLRVVLTVLIISILQNSLITKIEGALSSFYGLSENVSAGAILSTATIILLSCILYAFVMALAVPIAKSISGASGHLGLSKSSLKGS